MYKNCLIAGPTNSGKTILCHRLVKEHGFSRISGDALVLAFQNSFPELKIGHMVEGISAEAGYAATCGRFGRFLVNLTNALAWESTMPYVLDTFHVRPDDLVGIDTRKTQVLFLGYPDAEPTGKARQAQEYQVNTHGAAEGWLGSGVANAAEKFRIFIEMSRDYRAACDRIGYPFIDVSHDFTQALETAMNLAVSSEKLYDP